MKCEELLKMLNEYVDGTVDPSICEEFEKHMAGCNPCQVVVDNIRQTITLYKEGQPYELPIAFRERLHQTLRQRWKEKHAANHPCIPSMNDACEIPLNNATPADIQNILNTSRCIAVMGLSDNPERDGHRVALYLRQQGYRIIPVNPNAQEIIGEKSYANLREIPFAVDIVDIFRKPEAVPQIVDEAIDIGARTIWMQSGIVHNAAADKARSAGLKVVMNRCLMVEHRQLKAQTQS